MIINLQIGRSITPTRVIENARVRHWKFAAECSDVRGGLMPGAALKVVALDKTPGRMWVKVELPGHDPVAHLKIAGEEYGGCFRAL
jgi:hypothetical protein